MMAEEKRNAINKDEKVVQTIQPTDSAGAEAAAQPESQTVPAGRLQESRPGLARYWGAIVLILAGIILLLNNLGILPWTLWFNLLQLWPIFLILIGLDLLLRRSRFSQLIVFLVGLVVLVAAIAYSAVAAQPRLYDDLRRGMPWMPHMQFENFDQSGTIDQEVSGDAFGAIESREINADFGAGMLTITDNNAASYFARLTGQYSGRGGQPTLKSQMNNGMLRIDISDRTQNGFNVNFGEPRRDYKLTIGKPAISTSVLINVGAGKAEVDFTTTKLKNAEFKVGAGAIDMSIAEQSLPSDQMKLDVGAGSITLRLPKNVGVKLSHAVGLGNISVDGEKLGREGQFQTQGYDQAASKVSIDAHVGVGKLEIVRE